MSCQRSLFKNPGNIFFWITVRNAKLSFMKQFILQIIFILLIINNSISQHLNEYLENDWYRAKTGINAKSLMISGSWFAGMYLLSYGDEYLNENVKQLNTGTLKYYFKTLDNLGASPVAAPRLAHNAGPRLRTCPA